MTADTDGLVERLRELGAVYADDGFSSEIGDLFNEAAAEIERLTAALAKECETYQTANTLAHEHYWSAERYRVAWEQTKAALSRAEAQREEEWKPIESAPQQGEHVIVFDPRWGVCEGLHTAGLERRGWWIASFNGQVLEGNPTHWKPRPSPPAKDLAGPVREGDQS